MYDPNRPITRKHLEQAIDLAENEQEVTINGHTRKFDQAEWDCESACCIHGFAYLLARGRPLPSGSDITEYPPAHYHDIEKPIRSNLLSLFVDHRATPQMFRQVLEGQPIPNHLRSM